MEALTYIAWSLLILLGLYSLYHWIRYNFLYYYLQWKMRKLIERIIIGPRSQEDSEKLKKLSKQLKSFKNKYYDN